MGWLFRQFWAVVVFAAFLSLLGGVLLMQAAMSTGGNALGQGISGGITFTKAIVGGFRGAEAVLPDPVDPGAEKKSDEKKAGS